jgi:hypothetical protein
LRSWLLRSSFWCFPVLLPATGGDCGKAIGPRPGNESSHAVRGDRGEECACLVEAVTYGIRGRLNLLAWPHKLHDLQVSC